MFVACIPNIANILILFIRLSHWGDKVEFCGLTNEIRSNFIYGQKWLGKAMLTHFSYLD